MLRIKHLYFEIQLNCHYTVTPLFCYLPTACCLRQSSHRGLYLTFPGKAKVCCVLSHTVIRVHPGCLCFGKASY